ncbi:MAG: hypothetical protein AAFZ15_17345 [Bacteroidota bacterium]
MAVINTHYVNKKQMGSSLFTYLMDKWAFWGLLGFGLNISSLFANASLPDATGLSGVLIVLAAVFQKIREDFRAQKKLNLQLKVIEKIIDNEDFKEHKELLLKFLGMSNDQK